MDTPGTAPGAGAGVRTQERTCWDLAWREVSTWWKSSAVKPVEHFPKASQWWGSSDLIQKRTLVPWNKTGGWTEREGGFEWEGRRRRTLQHWWRLLENPWKPQGCREGAVRGCIKQRKQAWKRSKAARCASTGEIAEAAMCLYCQESGRVHCVKWLGAQDDHS